MPATKKCRFCAEAIRVPAPGRTTICAACYTEGDPKTPSPGSSLKVDKPGTSAEGVVTGASVADPKPGTSSEPAKDSSETGSVRRRLFGDKRPKEWVHSREKVAALKMEHLKREARKKVGVGKKLGIKLRKICDTRLFK